MVCYITLNDMLTYQIIGSDRSKLQINTSPIWLLSHPLYAAQALLQNVIWTRLDVMFVPESQPTGDCAVRFLIITS